MTEPTSATATKALQMRAIMITGASAGLGEHLARAYAAPNVVLGLVARNPQRLEQVAQQCRARGATVATGVIDVADWAEMRLWVARFDAAHGLDLAIVNAGIFTGHGPNRAMESAEEIRAQLRTNLEGVAATIDACLPGMRQRHRGHIAIIGSLAGLVPLADAPAYSASKSGAMAYGAALRDYLAEEGIAVSLVYPGHIKTAQADHQVGDLPGMITADDAAARIKRGLDRGRTFIAFPRNLVMMIGLGRLVDWRLRAWFSRDMRFHTKKDGVRL